MGEFHNNCNPIRIPNQGLLLGVSHKNAAYGKSRHDKHNMNHNGRHEYFHRFFIFEDRPPYAVLFESDFFCIPSAVDPSMCEFIQFVVSVEIDGSDVIIAYGVNDCE